MMMMMMKQKQESPQGNELKNEFRNLVTNCSDLNTLFNFDFVMTILTVYRTCRFVAAFSICYPVFVSGSFKLFHI